MTEKEKLQALLESVKFKIQILDAIENRLLEMLSLAEKAAENLILAPGETGMQFIERPAERTVDFKPFQ